MDSVARLEMALAIALERVYRDVGEYQEEAVVDYLDSHEIGEFYEANRYLAWKDVKRLVNELELLEQAAGIRHVKVVGHEERLARYRGRGFDMKMSERRHTAYLALGMFLVFWLIVALDGLAQWVRGWLQ